jgi:hypothetical protein
VADDMSKPNAARHGRVTPNPFGSSAVTHVTQGFTIR